MAAICAAAPQLAARAAVSGYVLDRARARVSRTQTRWFGKCVTSDARATRVVAIGLPPGRGPSRARDLVTDRAIPIPCSECNSKFSAKAQKKARVAFRVRAAVRSIPRSNGIRGPMGRFRFPVARLPGARRPATAATREDTPRRSRRSLSARAHRSVRSQPLPVPDRHRTKPLPRRRSPRRRSPSPSAPLAAPRCDSRRDAPSSPSRTHLSSSTSMPHPGTDHTTPKRRVVHRPNAPSKRFEGARRERGIPRT